MHYTLHMKIGAPTLTITDTRSMIHETTGAARRLAFMVSCSIASFARQMSDDPKIANEERYVQECFARGDTLVVMG